MTKLVFILNSFLLISIINFEIKIDKYQKFKYLHIKDIENYIDVCIDFKINKFKMNKTDSTLIILKFEKFDSKNENIINYTYYSYSLSVDVIGINSFYDSEFPTYKNLFYYKGLKTIIYQNNTNIKLLNLPLIEIPYENLQTKKIKHNRIIDFFPIEIFLNNNFHIIDQPKDKNIGYFELKALEKGIKFANINTKRQEIILKSYKKKKYYKYTKEHLKEYEKYKDSTILAEKNIKINNNNLDVYLDLFKESIVTKSKNKDSLIMDFYFNKLSNKSVFYGYEIKCYIYDKKFFRREGLVINYDYKGKTAIINEGEVDCNIFKLPLIKQSDKIINKNISKKVPLHDPQNVRIYLNKNFELIDVPSIEYMEKSVLVLLNNGIKFANISNIRRKKILKSYKKNKYYIYTEEHLKEYDKYRDSIILAEKNIKIDK